MSTIQKEARLHERTVQEIARQALSKVQGRHTTKEEHMAQRVSITLVDDLDGSPADETVTFGLDGTTYEIDLTEVHAKELRTRLEDFVGAARKVAGKVKKKAHGAPTGAIREWARDNGYEVSNRGVVPRHIKQAYEAAH